MWELISLTRDQIHLPCIGRWILNHWATREVSTHWYLKVKYSGSIYATELGKSMNRALPLERWLLNAGCWAWNYVVCWLHLCDKKYMWNSQFTNYPNMDEFSPILPPTPSLTLAPAFSKELKRIHRCRRGGARTLKGRLFCLLAGFPGHFLFMLTSSLKSQ